MATREAARAAKQRPPLPRVTLEAVRRVLLRLRNLDELEGFGVFGSLGGQQASRFDPDHSDIDVFIVLKDDLWNERRCDQWVRRITRALGRAFWRDVDVLVFTPGMLRKVPGWHAISLASDCPVLYDPRGVVTSVFRRIVEAARAADLVQEWVGNRRLWRKQHWVVGEETVVEVPEDDDIRRDGLAHS